MTDQSVRSIEELVGERVYKTDGSQLPFTDNFFGLIVIIDMLEHVENEKAFVDELQRIITPGGTLIVNAPIV